MMSADKSFDYFDATVLPNLEILTVFDHHRNELINQRCKMNDEIFNWGQSLISKIEETTVERRRLLKQEYENQKHYLEEKRQEYIEKALIYEKKKNKEQIGQLITQCNALKFELAALEFSMHPLPYLTLVTQDNLKHEQLRSTPIGSHENDTVIKMHTTESSPSTITSKNTKKKRSLLVTKSLNKNNPSVTYSDNSVEECPICSMVFSSYMDPSDRNIHVEEHFSDNIENHLTPV